MEEERIMKVWTNNKFNGIYPVGTAAVVIAYTAEEAANSLIQVLMDRECHGPAGTVFVEDMKVLPEINGAVRVLCDGDY